LATGSEDRKIKLYEPAKPWASTTLSGALQSITSIDFNASDEFLVASSTDHSTRVWNLTTKRIAVSMSHCYDLVDKKVIRLSLNLL
jgi:autophagy-related protein 16